MRRLVVMVAALAGAAALAAGFTSSAGAYGGGASHDTWQIGLSAWFCWIGECPGWTASRWRDGFAGTRG